MVDRPRRLGRSGRGEPRVRNLIEEAGADAQHAARFLTGHMACDVPAQDLRIDLTGLPALPRDRFVYSSVRVVSRSARVGAMSARGMLSAADPRKSVVPDDPRRGVPALSYDRLTPLYDALAGAAGFGERFASRVLTASGARDGETLLDVGGGTATLLILAKRRFPGVRAIGVDPDLRVLKRAHAKIRDAGVAVELLQAGAEALPLPDGSVDLAVSSLVFHHLPMDVKRAAAAEVLRVLAPGGCFLLADFGPPRSIAGRAFITLAQAFRLPEAETLRDNVAGALPVLLAITGFSVREAAPRYRGIDFLMATKDAGVRP